MQVILGYIAFYTLAIAPRGVIGLVRLASAALFAALRGRFAFAARLRALVMRAAARLRENAILLNFTVETFERLLKRVTRINFYFTHELSPTQFVLLSTLSMD